MKCVVVCVVEFLFIRWNFGMIEANPPAIINVLLVIASGIAVSLYVIKSFFDYISEMQ